MLQNFTGDCIQRNIPGVRLLSPMPPALPWILPKKARTAGYKKMILWTASPLYEIKMETDMI